MTELQNLDWQEFKNKLSEAGTSAPGRDFLARLAPLDSAAQAVAMTERVMAFAPLIHRGERARMESLDLFATWYQRLNRNAVLKTLELRDVRHFCAEVITLKSLLESEPPGILRSFHDRLMNADEPLSAIDQIMTPSGEIRNDASEKLFRLTEEQSGLARQIQNTLDRVVKNYQIEHLLQDKFVTTREGRWVLPIKSGMRHGFQGLVHDASQTRQTVYMEPQETVPLNNRLREVIVEIEQEIERLLTELSRYLAGLCPEFESSREILFEADTLLARAQISILLEAKPVEFSETEIRLNQLRHPTLFLKNPKVVSNTVELDKGKRVLLLSGPNAGGKTVLLKSIGLAAQMARCGLPVCADEGSRLPFFNTILAGIGDSQSVDADLSTFAAHLRTLQQATQVHGAEGLILIDEICGSTDPEEGTALARAFIESFSEQGVFAVITSHLGGLKRGWDKGSAVINGSLEFDPKAGPTYKFVLGVPGQSLAIQTAKRVGVSSAIIDRALENLSPAVKEYQSKIEEVDQLKGEIVRLQDKLGADSRAVADQKREYERMIAEFAEERERKLDLALREAERKIEEMIQNAKVQDVFRKHGELNKIKSELPEIVKPASTSTRERKAISTAEEFAEAYPPGRSVFVPLVGRDGIIQGKPNSKGEVPVLSSSMRIMVPWTDLKPPMLAESPTMAVLRKRGQVIAGPADDDRIVDLRGLTAEDAISQLEIQLDAASLGGEDRIKVIHGHGTDTLKRAVRSYLSRSVYVKKWQAGNRDTGGDGVTWAELK